MDSGFASSIRKSRWLDIYAACGKFNKIDAHTILDANLKKSLNDSMDVYVIIENILDDENIISRAPSEGARSQKPRTMKVGFSYKF